jgi:hypothetical protein
MSTEEQENVFAGVEPESAPELIDRYKDSSGKVRPELWRTGVDDLNKLNIAGGFIWANAGPAPFNNLPDAAIYQGNQPVGGEVTDIAIDPSGPTDSVIYIATNNGGIWKTTDGGSSWFPTSDSLPSLSMGAVALDPVNPSIVYAGSGNLFDGAGGFIKAAGLYKSVDAGKTWFVTDGGVFGSTFQGIGINRIICPAADSLLVGTKNGLFRSIDGGLNFGAIAPGFNDGKPVMPGFVTALVMDSDTTKSNTAWVAIRGLNEDGTVFSGGGLFRLTLNPDGSVSPSGNLLNNLGGLAGVQFGSIAFGQASPPNGQTIFASVQGQNAAGDAVFLNLYWSTDGGATWKPPVGSLKAALQAVASGNAREDDQSSYDFTLGVDPQNINLLYAGFKRIWSSQNGGANFAESSQAYGAALVHWDQHELVFSPKSHWVAGQPTDVWVGNDGGVARHRVVKITLATNASPIVITAANHGFLTGNSVIISGVSGNTAANSPPNAPYVITVIDQNTFSLNGSAGNGAYTNGGTAEGWTQLNAGACTHLFYGIDIGRGVGNNQFTYGGMQDNGTPGHRPSDPGTTWVAGIDGDGGMTAVDPAKADIVYGFVNDKSIRSTDQGANWALSSDDGFVFISGATNPPAPAPIVVTTVKDHLFLNGDKVTIAGVNGNTAANSPPNTPWVITKLTETTLSLNGSTGNGAYTGGGFAQGRRFGRNLQNPGSFVRRVGLVPSGNNPATTVYVAEERTLRKSTDGGANFAASPSKVFDRFVFSLVCPDANRIWVGTSDGQVHYSPDGGSSWEDFSPGGTGPVTDIAVDPASTDRVAVVYAGFSSINSRARTKHCFLTTNNGADWADISGTDGAMTGNLPDLPFHSVVFDDSTVPPTIIVGTETGVLRSANNGVSWERLGTGLPRVTCRSLGLDNVDRSRSPRLLRLGTYGRSCFELSRRSGPSLAVEANLAFGGVIQGQSAILAVRLLNVGDASINLTSFTKSAGDADFDFETPPNLLSLTPGEVRPFGIRFTAGGNDKDIRTAMFTVQSPDVPTVQIAASGVTFTARTPRLAVNACLNFGEVERGANRVISIIVANTGLDVLKITEFALSGSSDFSLATPPLPLNLASGTQQSFDVRFAPGTWGGSSNATLRIASNDPRQPSLDVPATGSAPFNAALLIGLIVLGAAVIAGGVGIYEAAKKH